MKKNRKHLPLFGAGPAYVVTISVCTVAALVLNYTEIIPNVTVSPITAAIWKIAGALLFVEGVLIWLSAVFSSRLTRNIKENHLVTTGVYAFVRHPVYAAFMLAEWGILLWPANPWLWMLLPLYWLFLSILVRCTEEKWLLDCYGEEYAQYARRVNRCIPWFPRSEKKD